MGPLDLFTGPLRSLLGVAERAEEDVQQHVPASSLEARLEEAVAAVHRTAESLERHAMAVESLERHAVVVESLADSLPPLTESVTELTGHLDRLMKFAAPVAAAERELSRMERLFGRKRQVPAVGPPEGDAGPPEGDAGQGN